MSNDENVMVLYGSSKQWIELTARDITLEYRANGYDVREVDAKTDDLTTAFESGLFDTDPIFVVLTNPQPGSCIRVQPFGRSPSARRSSHRCWTSPPSRRWHPKCSRIR